jgi:NitT/TauT family transport system substrate-binding protein
MRRQTLRKRILATLFIVIVLLICFLWYRRGVDDRQGDAGVQRLTIAQAGDFFLYAPLYIAIDAGFFNTQGLKVSIVSTGGDDKTFAAVVSGDVQFGIADPTFVAVSESRGAPGKVIASIVNGVPFWGITENPNIPKITRPSELDSYSVGTFPSPSTAFTLQRKMFLDGGLTPNIRQGAFGTLLAMLRSRQADIVLELEPNVSQAITKGARIVYSLGNFYGDFAITGLTTTPDLLKKKPELAQKVVCALQMALDFTRTNPEETLEILSKRFPEIDKTVAKNALARVISDKIIPENLVTSEQAWSKAIELRTEIGDIKNPKSMGVYVDNSYAEWAQTNCHKK